MPIDARKPPADPFVDPLGALRAQLVACQRSEQALKHSERKYRSIFQNNAQLLAIVNLREGRFIEINEGFTRLTGYARHEVLGRTTLEMGVWEDPAHRNRFLDRLTKVGRLDNEEMAFKTKWGDTRRGLLSAWLMDIDDELWVVSSIQDITERKRTEQALRQSEERMRLAFDAAYVISFEWDIVHNRVHRHASKDPVLKSTLDEPTTFEAVANLVHPGDRERFKANVFAAMERQNGHYENEYRITHPQGEVCWIHENGLVERDSHGRPVLLIGLSQDITERKNFELKLQQVNETLEQQVAERTALAERRARQLQALAVELIEAEECERKRISGLLHDDLQQTIAAARLQLQSVSTTPPPDPIVPNVLNLLEDALHKSRQLSHALCPPVLYHARFVDSLRWLTRQMEQQFGLVTALEADEKLRIERQPLKVFLFRAVQELLFNIIKHAGVKKARICLNRTEQNIVIDVSDQGGGFDPGILDEETTKVGLGILSLRERASYVGGDLKIESAPGRGSRFILTVPVKNPQDHPKQPQIPEAPPEPDRSGTAAPASKSGMRVLFVDDHRVIRQGLIRLVAGQPDIQVAGEAANGQEAVELARQLLPDVVVMDISMPGMDGFEATRRIKDDRPEIRVIGLSMHDDPQMSQKMLEAGAEALVSKTSSSSELIKAIYGFGGGGARGGR